MNCEFNIYGDYAAGSDEGLKNDINSVLLQGATKKEFEKIADVCAALVTVKNERYGDSNLIKRGVAGINYRLEDKLSRIENATKLESEKNSETILQTYFDIAGYCINAVRLLVEGKI